MSNFGFTKKTGGGDFLPRVQYDARSGIFSRIDRVDTGGGFVSEGKDYKLGEFKALMDLENLEVGWINFMTGGAPDFCMKPLDPNNPILPDQPTNNHKQGLRVMLKLAKEAAGSQPAIRELSSTAQVFLDGMDELYDAYKEGKKGENVDKLPIVQHVDTTKVTSGSGARQTSNYMPRFQIVGWALRGDLVFEPKGGATIRPATAQTMSSVNAPPATGSQRVAPPQAATAEADFG
jgi:hypothetical protein